MCIDNYYNVGSQYNHAYLSNFWSMIVLNIDKVTIIYYYITTIIKKKLLL